MYHQVILFDGVCKLCNRFVNYIVKRDRKRCFRFASVQSDFANELLINRNEIHNADKTVFYFRYDKLMSKSAAVLYILKDLGGIGALLFVFIAVPRPIRDFVYKIVSKNRYRLFGKRDSCRVPDEKEQVWFLE